MPFTLEAWRHQLPCSGLESDHGDNCRARSLSGGFNAFFASRQEKTLTTWDLRMADPVRIIDLDEEVLSISSTPDDAFLATAGTGQVVKAGAKQRVSSPRVQVWDIRNEQARQA